MIQALPEYQNVMWGVLIGISSNTVCTVCSNVAIELNDTIFHTQRHYTHGTCNRMHYPNVLGRPQTAGQQNRLLQAAGVRAVNTSPLQ